MPVQDLTPQLRTRLSRVERAVGIFVSVATIFLLAGFGYYIYHTAQRKGWFLLKVPYHTFMDSVEGIRIGDPVKLYGFDAGAVTEITAMEPFNAYGNVYIQFEIRHPYYGYIWDDSKVKVGGDFLGKRYLEVTEGGLYRQTNLHASYKIENGKVLGIWDDKEGEYLPFEGEKKIKGYTLLTEAAPPITARLEAVANQVEEALPGILALTNRLNGVLANLEMVSSNANSLLVDARPTLTNLAVITGNIKDPNGSLGQWLIPTNLSLQLTQTLASARTLITNANQTVENSDKNVTMLAISLEETLVNLASITSNLNEQVEANTNLISNISTTISNANTMVQGLKTHWLLRSAFKEKKPEKKSRPYGR
ncbi:MAG: MlaD family protein [Verrucomicrobiota bacterium]|nr:MlaD family protein [Verrucomicrobiota bacterium]